MSFFKTLCVSLLVGVFPQNTCSSPPLLGWRRQLIIEDVAADNEVTLYVVALFHFTAQRLG